MAPALGAPLGGVRIHESTLPHAIDARAFTTGHDIFFNRGELQPQTRRGQALIAHELAHVVQQGPSSGGRAPALNTIFRKPKGPVTSAAPKPKGPAFFHGCRKVDDHKHAPTGDWSRRQKAWAASCAAAGGALQNALDDLRKGKFSLRSIRGRPIVECICANSDPATALEAARRGTMFPGGLASEHIDHYLTGKGADFQEDLRALLLEDAGVRKKLGSAIKRAPRGCVFISQADYAEHDWMFALGGIDRMEYAVDAAAGTVHVFFKDRYQWHPEDKARPSNCVHVAAVELKATGAADFWMVGDAVVPLEWFSSGPSFFERFFG